MNTYKINFSFWWTNKESQKKQIYILFQIPMTLPGSEMLCFNKMGWTEDDSLIKNFHEKNYPITPGP